MRELDCDEFVELVTAFLDGALDAEGERRFVEHLAMCDGCELYLDQFRQTIQTLKGLPAETLPAPGEPLSGEARDALLAAFRDVPH